MKNLMKRIIEAGFTKEQIDAEVSWLRCIDFNNEKDVYRAAFEIKRSIAEGKSLL